jgi:hypothetical protein
MKKRREINYQPEWHILRNEEFCHVHSLFECSCQDYQTKQSILDLRRFTLIHFTHINVYNEVHILFTAHRPNANSLIRNLRNKVEHVLTKTQTNDATFPSQSGKPGETYESHRLTLAFVWIS